MNKKCLIVASISSMIGQFNMPNIELLLSMGYNVSVAANFSFGNTFDNKNADDLWNALKDMNIDVYNIIFVRSIFSFKNIIAYKQIKELINNNNYSLIHCHSPIGSVITRIAARKKRFTGTKIIYTAHGFHFYKGAPLINWLLYYPIEKYLSRHTDVLITINKEDYEISIRKMKTKIIHYIKGVGINLEKFSTPMVTREIKRKEINIPLNTIILISIGELIKRKNHQIVIKAISKIKSLNIIYIICGNGKQNKYLKKICKQLHVEDKVLLLGYREDITDLLQVSDIYIFPSLQEGLSVSLMEAMAAGLPCVVSRIRGNVDLIVEKKGGFLCEINNADEYSNAIKKIIEDDKLKNCMSEYNKNVIKKYNVIKVNEKMKEIYEKCI